MTDPFKISALLPDFQRYMDGYRAASNATRARVRSQLDVRYGEAERQRIDLFFRRVSCAAHRSICSFMAATGGRR